MPADARVQLLLRNVSRVAASLRGGLWNDQDAPVLPMVIGDLLSVVQSFGGCPVYGWEFFDTGDAEMAEWGDRLSLDWRVNEPVHAGQHSFTLFQEGESRHLDVCIWFATIEAWHRSGAAIPLEELAAGGKRWWDALIAHDPRTQDSGITPMK